MATETQVPLEIAEIIERKAKALLEERRQEEETKQRKHDEAEALGKSKYDEHLQASILKAPEWIRQYLDMTDREPDFMRIASGWEDVENIYLVFSIPGLARMMFDPKRNQWCCESAGWNREYSESEPYLRFDGSLYWNDDIEFMLGRAQNEMREYNEYLEQYVRKQEELAQRQEAYALEERERFANNREAETMEEQVQQTEEDKLLALLKSDPIAIAMLKAYVMIYQERNAFTTQIEDANNSLYSMDEYWSSKAASLRRQADEAQRHAEEERYRLQSDLDDMEAKLKKAERDQRW